MIRTLDKEELEVKVFDESENIMKASSVRDTNPIIIVGKYLNTLNLQYLTKQKFTSIIRNPIEMETYILSSPRLK